MLLSEIRVSYLNKAFYHYVKNRLDSLSRRYDENSERQNVALRDVFVNLMKDTDLKGFVNSKFSYAIVSKAFWGGKNIYTSRSYKKHFEEYLESIKKQPNSIDKFLLLCSNYGFYHPVIDFVVLCLKAKFLVLRVV